MSDMAIEKNESGSISSASPALKLYSIFSKLCERMDEKVVRESPIAETDLNNISKIAVYCVRNNIEVKSDQLENLSMHITDYLRYKIKHETDLKRAFSYIRLSQTVNILHEFQSELDLEYKAHITLSEIRNYSDVIKEIQLSPGISAKKLQNLTSLQFNVLCIQTHELEKQGVIIGHGKNAERYYILTNYGEIVCRNLSGKHYNEWIDQWSDKRIVVLCAFLKLCKETKLDWRIQNILHEIASIGEDRISEYYDDIMKGRKGYQEKNLDYQYIDRNMFSPFSHIDLTQRLVYRLNQINNIPTLKDKRGINNELKAYAIRNIRDNFHN